MSGKLDKFLQNPGTNSYKDLYPPVNMQMYYAVTMVNGEGQEDKDVNAQKVRFANSVLLPKPLIPKSAKKKKFTKSPNTEILKY